MTSPPAPVRRRAARIATIAAGVALVAASITAGVLGSTHPAPSATPVRAAVEPDLRPHATPEQAYALSLPVLDTWLEEEFDAAWVATANTLEAAASALDHAAQDDERYRHWVTVFEGVVAVADAVAAQDPDAARDAFAPLLEAYPGPYADVAVDTSLSFAPHSDAQARIGELDAAVAAGDRLAVRRSAGDVAEALAEVVLAATIDAPEDAPDVLARLLPAFHAIDAVHDAVLDGGEADAARALTELRSATDAFHAWYLEAAS